MSMRPLMQLADARFAYSGRQWVINRVSATVSPGALHAVIGPNGSGKSTLIRLLLGNLAPRGGRVLFEGRRLRWLSAQRRAAHISYVPQRAGASFAFTVREMVQMGRFALAPDHAAVVRALDACDLASVAERPFAQLSVGQQQRVLLARAMAQAAGKGRLMLLDEPTSAMDLAHEHQTMEHLRWLVSHGMALVVAVHDLNLAARYADRVWLMDEGRLVADGPRDDVLKPEVLEPVYDVKIKRYTVADDAAPGGKRALFDVQLPPRPWRL